MEEISHASRRARRSFRALAHSGPTDACIDAGQSTTPRGLPLSGGKWGTPVVGSGDPGRTLIAAPDAPVPPQPPPRSPRSRRGTAPQQRIGGPSLRLKRSGHAAREWPGRAARTGSEHDEAPDRWMLLQRTRGSEEGGTGGAGHPVPSWRGGQSADVSPVGADVSGADVSSSDGRPTAIRPSGRAQRSSPARLSQRSSMRRMKLPPPSRGVVGRDPPPPPEPSSLPSPREDAGAVTA